MKHVLVEMMSAMTTLSIEEEQAIISSIPIREYAKGTHLLKEGEVAQDSYFVIEGCVREYTLSDGEEITTAFFTEEQSVANFDSIANQTPSTYYLICNEDVTAATFNTDREQELYRRFPRFESFCRSGMEQMMGEQHEQLKERITLKPEQLYEKLLADRPGLLHRVPQYQIASYLGIKPESLSRLRRRLTKK